LEDAVHGLLVKQADYGEADAVYQAFRWGVMPVDAGMELLGQVGAVDGKGRITSLGGWMRERLDAEAPPVWRRVRLPATTTLDALHEVIQVVFDWDDDHLHVFTVDGRRYADPYAQLDVSTVIQLRRPVHAAG
jgi:hypothetical protein